MERYNSSISRYYVNFHIGPLYTNEIKARSFPIHVEKGGANGLNPGDFLKTYSPTNCPQQNNWKA